MKTIIGVMFGVLLFAAAPEFAIAQEGCRAARGSCSQMNADCEKKCQAGTNPSACVARVCSGAMTGCKANGVWKSVLSPACWKTNNRS